MNYLPVPKTLKWSPNLTQCYQTTSKILVTSGCSFTSSTLQLECPASWPGYVIDRCGFESGIDYSFPGAGNRYIGDSILYHFNNISKTDASNFFVIVMWSGIDRIEKIIESQIAQPRLGNLQYQRLAEPVSPLTKKERLFRANQSAQKIIEVYTYLTQRNIPFAFTFYSNLLFEPFLPKRDTTFEFINNTDKQLIEVLKKLPWIPTNPMDYLYEYAFIHDYLNDGDYFHPPVECNLEWTDRILLPALKQQGLIRELLL